MFHELLLALQGFTGGLFTYQDGIATVVKVPFLSSSEIHILEQFSLLVAYYKRFQELIKASTTGRDAGLYHRAFCKGLDEVLRDYRSMLLDLERDVLKDRYITLAHFQHHLSNYHILFPALMDVIDQLQAQKAQGCQVLDVVYHKALTKGICMVRDAINKILRACNGVFYKQMAAWMLYGIVEDPYSEFFIQARPIQRELNSNNNSNSESSSQQQDRDKIPDNSLLRYQLVPGLLPTYIPLSLAEKILFVGRSVILFKKHSPDGGHVTHNGSIFMSREGEVARLMEDLHQREEFSLAQFEETVNHIRQIAAEHLWQFYVEKVDLTAHLRTMREIYLLGRGELFLGFIDCASHLVKGTLARNTEHGLNRAFRKALEQSFLSNDALLDDFPISIRLAATNEDLGSKELGWSCVSLVWDVPPTLQMFFTPSVLDRYNWMFQFLLTVKSVQVELHQCWVLHMQEKDNTISRNPKYISMWHMRNYMTCFVDNLQYYLQVDVVESHFASLMNKIRSVHDFEAIQHAHEEFLSTVLLQSFISDDPKKPSKVYLILMSILKRCLRYCKFVSNHASGPLNEQQQQELDNISSRFFLMTSHLFPLLPNISRNQDNPSLAQFMARIDADKYFAHAKKHESTAAASSL